MAQSQPSADTLPGLLWHHAHTRPEAVALREKYLGIWQEVTWSGYLDHVRTFSLGLRSLGVQAGQAVGIQAENCQEWLYSDLAIQCAGARVCTIYPTSSAAEVKHIVQTAQVRVVIVGDQEHLDKVLSLVEEGLPIDRIVIFDPKGAGAHRGHLVLSFKDVQAMGRRYEALYPQAFLEAVLKIRPDDIYDIMFTSGTSGLPKGAMCDQRGPVVGAEMFLKHLQLTAEDCWLSYLPLSHAFERIMAIAVHLKAGNVICMAESMDAAQANVVEIQPDVFGAVPRILEKIKTVIDIRMGRSSALKKWLYRKALQFGLSRARRMSADRSRFVPAPAGQILGYPQSKPQTMQPPWTDRCLHGLMYWLVYRHLLKQVGLLRVRYLICGAAPISDELFSYYIALGVPIMNGFGMTELHNIPCMALPSDAVPGMVGYPLSGWEVKKADDGELCIRGPIGFKGYAGENATAASMLDAQGWLHTGDLCEIYDNGYVAIIGRKKDVLVTSGGKNISPELIENKLKASAYISEAIVIGEGRHFLSCLIELDADAVGDWLQMQGQSYSTLRDMAALQSVIDLIEAQISEVNQALARVETIKKFRIIPRDLSHDDGEMTPTRKVKRSILEKQFAHLIDDMYRPGEILQDKNV